MDRYFVFAFAPERAHGGLNDLDSSYKKSSEAVDRASELTSLGLVTHVLDRNTMTELVFE